jgi:DNA repair ATPase RecN
MEDWRKRFTQSDVSNVNKSNVKDVLLELRNMNNNYIEFFAFMMDEFTKLKTDGTAVNQKITDLETSMDKKHEQYDLKFSTIESQLKVLQEKDEEREEKLLEMECRQRKLNLIIPKLEEKELTRQTRQNRQNEETYTEIHAKVVDYLENQLGIVNARSMLFRNIHRLGKRNPAHTRPRNVIVAFIHQPDVDTILQAARDLRNPNISIKTDLPKQYNEIRNALLAIRADYRDLPGDRKVRCKLTYIKFKPTLFKLIGEQEIKVEIARGEDGKYHEVNIVHQ